MILEYGLKNFFGFKEGCIVNFRVPKKVSKKGVADFLCVKGKNASGKTNLLKALSFISDFCTDSFQDYKPKDYIRVEPFFRNQNPIEFYIEFIWNNCEYSYELSLIDTEVFSEVLYRKNNRKVKVIERQKNEFTHLISEFSELASMKLRTNASFISSFKQYDLDLMDSLSDVYCFFDSITYNVSYGGLVEHLPDINQISKVLYHNEEMFNFTKDIIVASDTGVSDIVIRQKDDQETGKVIYTPLFIHEVSGELYPLPIFAVSSGTKSLFSQLGKYQFALKFGGVLCIDEFDINLHPHILPKLIGLFDCPENNPKNAQLIFTTHNSEIMEYMGKYRTYLVEKENNECFAYRLDEIPSDILRNDRAILPAYNSGKLGGVPVL